MTTIPPSFFAASSSSPSLSSSSPLLPSPPPPPLSVSSLRLFLLSLFAVGCCCCCCRCFFPRLLLPPPSSHCLHWCCCRRRRCCCCWLRAPPARPPADTVHKTLLLISGCVSFWPSVSLSLSRSLANNFSEAHITARYPISLSLSDPAWNFFFPFPILVSPFFSLLPFPPVIDFLPCPPPRSGLLSNSDNAHTH